MPSLLATCVQVTCSFPTVLTYHLCARFWPRMLCLGPFDLTDSPKIALSLLGLAIFSVVSNLKKKDMNLVLLISVGQAVSPSPGKPPAGCPWIRSCEHIGLSHGRERNPGLTASWRAPAGHVVLRKGSGLLCALGTVYVAQGQHFCVSELCITLTKTPDENLKEEKFHCVSWFQRSHSKVN